MERSYQDFTLVAMATELRWQQGMWLMPIVPENLYTKDGLNTTLKGKGTLVHRGSHTTQNNSAYWRGEVPRRTYAPRINYAYWRGVPCADGPFSLFSSFFFSFFHVFLLFIGTSAKESKGKGIPLQQVTPFMTPLTQRLVNLFWIQIKFWNNDPQF